MKKLLLLCLLLVILPPELAAGVYDPPPTDKSVSMLGMIFGSNVGGIPLGGSPNIILSDVFRMLNQIIVTVGALVLTYVGLISVINTAQEGTAMGKKWSSIWIPMRSLLGMALMIPAPSSGYSLVQIAVMWVIMQGIGAADQIWNVVLNNLEKGITLDIKKASKSITSAGQDINNVGIEEHSKTISTAYLLSATCMATIQEIANDSDLCNADNKSLDICKYGSKMMVWTDIPKPSKNFPKIDKDGSSYSYQGITMNFGIKNTKYDKVCGSFEISGTASKESMQSSETNPISDAAVQAQAQLNYQTKLLALTSIGQILQPLANLIAKGGVDPRSGTKDGDPRLVDPSAKNPQPWTGLAKPKWNTVLDYNKNSPNPGGYHTMAANNYVNIMNGLTIQNNNDSYLNKWISKVVGDAKQYGWVTAASFYFILNQASELKLIEDAQIPPTYSNITLDEYDYTTEEGLLKEDSLKDTYDTDKKLEPRKRFSNAYNTKDFLQSDKYPFAAILIRKLQEAAIYNNTDTMDVKVAKFDSAPKKIKKLGFFNVTSRFYKYINQLLNFTIKHMGTESNDPLLGMARFGNFLLFCAEIMWMAIVLISIPLAFMASSAACVQGGFGATIAFLVLFLVPLLVAVIGFLWTCGALLGIYVPLVPYIVFTVGILSWLLLVIEAVIAAPLLALALVLPSNDELGKLIAGLQLLANIFLRPLLMVIGFLFAIQIFKTIIHFVNWSIRTNFETVMKLSSYSSYLLYPCAVIGIYSAFVVSLTNKSFALIYGVPDRILRWIGGNIMSTEAGEELSAAKGAASKSGEQVGGVASGAQKGLSERYKSAQAKADAKKENKGDDKKQG